MKILTIQLREFEKFYELAIAHRQSSDHYSLCGGKLRDEVHEILRTKGGKIFCEPVSSVTDMAPLRYIFNNNRFYFYRREKGDTQRYAEGRCVSHFLCGKTSEIPNLKSTIL